MRRLLIPLAAGVALTVLFHDPLWRGGGFVGGDVYSYYFPQKVHYADCLRRGGIPLWNPLVAHGYPVVGESQTGVFYPPHVALYGLLDPHTAYHVGHLLHYVVAFVGMARLARAQRFGGAAAALAGLVYAYGWFPMRSCWEWAIVGGAWLPWAVLLTDRIVGRTDRTVGAESASVGTATLRSSARAAVGLALVLAVQMLAGHYHIAFLTQLTVVAWTMIALFARRVAAENRDAEQSPAPVVGNWSNVRGSTLRSSALVGVALAAGFALAAVQWLPTAELRRLSQRAEQGTSHDPARGSLPWRNLTMLTGWVRVPARPDATDGAAGSDSAASWQPWCSPLVERDRVLAEGSAAPTNQAEATLFFGALPFGLAIVGCLYAARTRDRRAIGWIIAAFGATFYATGVLVPWLRPLPGFGWFHGPGRYGLIATFFSALLAGMGLEALTRRSHGAPDDGVSPLRPQPLRTKVIIAGVFLALAVLTIVANSAAVDRAIAGTNAPSPLMLFGATLPDGAFLFFAAGALAAAVVGLGLLWKDQPGRASDRRAGSVVWTAVVFGVTAVELFLASRLVTYTATVSDPPLRHLAESPVRKRLENDAVWPRGQIRLDAPGGNLPSMLGVASTPAYFTFGPREYATPADRPWTNGGRPTPDQTAAASAAWRRAGITHVLTFGRLDAAWGVDLVWSGIDPFLNAAWGRFREPLFLYRVKSARGRVWFEQTSAKESAVGNDGADGDAADRQGAVRSVSSTANRVTVGVDSSAAGRVVLTDLDYPGWSVTVDGRPAVSIRHDKMFRAVEIDAGPHRVEWSYRPGSVAWGTWVSGATLCALVAVGLFAGRWSTPRRPI